MPVRQIGSKFYYDFRLNGRRHRGVIPEARNKAQAKQAEIRLRNEFFEGRYGKPVSRTTFKDFAEKVYLPWAREQKRSWRNDVSRVKPLIAYFGNKRLDEISPFLIEKYKTERRKSETKRGETRSLASVNRELQLLSRIFSLAMSKGDVSSNPSRKVKLLPGENRRTRYLLPDEEERLMGQLTGRRSYLRPILILALQTGMRRGEILGLKWEHVDFHRGMIHVTSTKTDVDRQVPMNDEVKNELLALHREAKSEYVFTNPHTGGRITDIKKAFASAREDAETEDLRFHDLRHTAGTRMADAGMPIPVIAEILGHANLQTTMRYSHATDEAKRRAVKALERGGENRVVKIWSKAEKAAG